MPNFRLVAGLEPLSQCFPKLTPFRPSDPAALRGIVSNGSEVLLNSTMSEIAASAANAHAVFDPEFACAR